MDNEMYQLFVIAQQIAQFINEKILGKVPFQDERKELPQPYLNQSSGLVLEFNSWKVPEAIVTPWGRWPIAGMIYDLLPNGASDAFYEIGCLPGMQDPLESIIQEFGAIEFTRQRGGDPYFFGLQYSGNIQLPEAHLLPQDFWRDTGECTQEWQLLREYYRRTLAVAR